MCGFKFRVQNIWPKLHEGKWEQVHENSSVVAGVISVIKLTNRDRLLPSIERVKYDENFLDILRSSRRRWKHLLQS